MKEVLSKAAAPLAVLAMSLGSAVTAHAEGGPVLGPATREVEKCDHVKLRNGAIERCMLFVNGVIREMESDTKRTFTTRESDGDVVRDDYTLHRLTRYDSFGQRTLHLATSTLHRTVNGQPVPVVAQLPPSETTSGQTPPRPNNW